MPAARRLLPALCLVAASLGCVDGSTSFNVKYASGSSPGALSMSVLGVYHDGRMSPDAWAEIGGRLSPALGKPMCPTAYGDDLRAASPERFEDLDRATQSEGITETLLERLAPSAEGDAILVLSLRVRRGTGQPLGDDPTGLTNSNAGPLPGSRRPQGPMRTPTSAVLPRLGEIHLTATLFSVKGRSTLGRVDMTYVGGNIADAIQKFVTKLGEELPGSTCRGWRWDAPG